MSLRRAWMAILFAGCLHPAWAQELKVVNPLNLARTPEVVEMPLDQVLRHLHLSPAQATALVAEDVSNGSRIPIQLCAAGRADSPPCLLLLVQLPARGQIRIRFRIDPGAPAIQPLVFGRDAPERKDDFAWENQQVAYRIYGPALEATGEITSGIDVWSKRIPNFVIDAFYKRDAEGARTHNPELTYHKDNGQGMDSYYVGPSRGCGGTAVFDHDQLIVSKNYTSLRILENGPIRFSFQVTYAPWTAGGAKVVETKRITLDAGTHLNKIVSTYTFGGPQSLDLAAAVAVHEGAAAGFPVAGSVASVWDTPQDPSAGRIATGLVASPREHARTLQAAGHALLLFTRRSGEPFTYFAGSGWSKADMPTASSWDDYLVLQLKMLENPLILRWEGRE